MPVSVPSSPYSRQRHISSNQAVGGSAANMLARANTPRGSLSMCGGSGTFHPCERSLSRQRTRGLEMQMLHAAAAANTAYLRRQSTCGSRSSILQRANTASPKHWEAEAAAGSSKFSSTDLSSVLAAQAAAQALPPSTAPVSASMRAARRQWSHVQRLVEGGIEALSTRVEGDQVDETGAAPLRVRVSDGVSGDDVAVPLPGPHDPVAQPPPVSRVGSSQFAPARSTSARCGRPSGGVLVCADTAALSRSSSAHSIGAPAERSKSERSQPVPAASPRVSSVLAVPSSARARLRGWGRPKSVANDAAQADEGSGDLDDASARKAGKPLTNLQSEMMAKLFGKVREERRGPEEDEGGDGLSWCHRCIRHPLSGKGMWWDVWMALLILWTSIEVPFTVAFVAVPPTRMPTVIDVLDGIVDGCFFLDIIVTFTTGYIDEDDAVTMEPWLIAKAYLRSWFVIDFVSAFPFDTIVLAAAGDSPTGQMLAFVSMVKLLRLLRLHKLLQYAPPAAAQPICVAFPLPWPLARLPSVSRLLATRYLHRWGDDLGLVSSASTILAQVCIAQPSALGYH